jgi:hypothetical protein
MWLREPQSPFSKSENELLGFYLGFGFTISFMIYICKPKKFFQNDLKEFI